MTPENHCPACNATLAANAPQGLCPACLLKGGLETKTHGGGGSNPGRVGDFVSPTPAELAPLFPELEILELVGQGGMGVVYKARQKRLDRFVALKILSPAIGLDPTFAERFNREARAMAMLSHPHVVTVYDFGQTPCSAISPGAGARSEGTIDSSGLPTERPEAKTLGSEGGLYWFIMEFVDGVNVRRLLDSGKLTPGEALAIVPQICEALQFAHDHGVVHRDIKPENLLLDKQGRIKIADFGLAKLIGQNRENLTLSSAGQVLGTPHYMAPEQIEHPLEVDHRADIYSLGVVFYQMLTGELPMGRFAPPSKKVTIDVRLDEVVLRALEKEPKLRYQQASQIKSEVESIVTNPPCGSVRPAATERTWQSPAMGWGHFVGQLFGTTFTSPLAYRVANLSALGFLGSLAFLSYLPFPGSQRCNGFAGFAGFFGLIGIAFMIEMAVRRRRIGPARIHLTADGQSNSIARAVTRSAGAVVIFLSVAWSIMSHDIASIVSVPTQENIFRPDHVAAVAITVGLLGLGIMIFLVKKNNWVRMALSVAVLWLLLLCITMFTQLATVARSMQPLLLEPPASVEAGRTGVGQGRPSPPPSPDPESASTQTEIAHVKLQYAEEELKRVEIRHKAGIASEEDLVVARRNRDIAAADAKGDIQAAATARLRYAEDLLGFVKLRYEVGAATDDELVAAMRDRDVAAIELKELQPARLKMPLSKPAPEGSEHGNRDAPAATK